MKRCQSREEVFEIFQNRGRTSLVSLLSECKHSAQWRFFQCLTPPGLIYGSTSRDCRKSGIPSTLDFFTLKWSSSLEKKRKKSTSSALSHCVHTHTHTPGPATERWTETSSGVWFLKHAAYGRVTQSVLLECITQTFEWWDAYKCDFRSALDPRRSEAGKVVSLFLLQTSFCHLAARLPTDMLRGPCFHGSVGRWPRSPPLLLSPPPPLFYAHPGLGTTSCWMHQGPKMAPQLLLWCRAGEGKKPDRLQLLGSNLVALRMKCSSSTCSNTMWYRVIESIQLESRTNSAESYQKRHHTGLSDTVDTSIHETSQSKCPQLQIWVTDCSKYLLFTQLPLFVIGLA